MFYWHVQLGGHRTDPQHIAGITITPKNTSGCPPGCGWWVHQSALETITEAIKVYSYNCCYILLNFMKLYELDSLNKQGEFTMSCRRERHSGLLHTSSSWLMQMKEFIYTQTSIRDSRKLIPSWIFLPYKGLEMLKRHKTAKSITVYLSPIPFSCE